MIEVVAALVILGGAVTTLLVAQARCVWHLRVSGWQLTARELAGELTAQWELDGKVDVREPAEGAVDGHPGWSWRRSSTTHTMHKGIRGHLVALEIIRNDNSDPIPWRRHFYWLVEDAIH